MAKRDKRGWLWSVPILMVAVLTLALVLIFALKGPKESSLCSANPYGSDCEEFETGGICYCIVKESDGENTQQLGTDIFQLAQQQCNEWGGQLSTPDDDKLLKWLAKRLFLKAADRALIGLKRIGSKWMWVKAEGQMEAIELAWRVGQPSHPNHPYAMIDVVWYNEEGAKAYYYYDYENKNDDVEWYGFSSTDGQFDPRGDKSYFVCHYDRVYLFGGDNPASWENVESFSPAEDQSRIEVVLDLGVKRPVAGLFQGKVLVASGRLADGTSSKAAVLYDPISKNVTKIHHMLTPRHYAAAVVLEDEDTFVVCGGYNRINGNGKVLKDCEKYSSNSSTGGYGWTYNSSMKTKRCRFVLAELHGKLYAIAGFDGGILISSVESFDPKSNLWSYKEPYPVSQKTSAGVTFDNHIFVCGGATQEETSNECYKYSDIANNWTQVAEMNKGRYSHSMVVAHGTIFVLHKHDVEMYVKDRDIWELQDAQLIDYRRYSAAVTFPHRGHVQEKILLFGGDKAPSQVNVESFCPGNVTLNKVYAVFDLSRESPVAVAVGNNIMVAGGRSNSGGDSYKSAVLYDPNSKTFTKVQDMIHARHHAAAVVFDDIVFMCGGSEDDQILDYCEKYANNKWVPFASMLTAKKQFAMAELNGLIYAIGGYDGEDLSSVESYNPKSDAWTPEAALPGNFYGPKAATFDDQIYLCGGKKEGTLTSECFTYSDSTKKWTPAAGLNLEQRKHSMIVASGMLLSFHGYDVEMYLKTFDKWIPGPTELLFQRLYSSAATLTDNGTHHLDI